MSQFSFDGNVMTTLQSIILPKFYHLLGQCNCKYPYNIYYKFCLHHHFKTTFLLVRFVMRFVSNFVLLQETI